jgi:hypothetical protein
MGKVKEQWLAEIESDRVSHERYWLDEMFNCHEPVLPDSYPQLEFHHEKDLRVQQYQSRPHAIG